MTASWTDRLRRLRNEMGRLESLLLPGASAEGSAANDGEAGAETVSLHRVWERLSGSFPAIAEGRVQSDALGEDVKVDPELAADLEAALDVLLREAIDRGTPEVVLRTRACQGRVVVSFSDANHAPPPRRKRGEPGLPARFAALPALHEIIVCRHGGLLRVQRDPRCGVTVHMEVAASVGLARAA